MPTELSDELQYLLVVVGLFVVPRALQRFSIPSAITCVALGAAFGMGFGLFRDEPTVALLATLGIVALFLFAGLEVDVDELRRGARVLAGHLVVQCVLLAGGAFACAWAFDTDWQSSLLVALALLTPSTGFILDSLGSYGLSPDQRFWVKSKAIASELIALFALFVAVRSESAATLLLSGGTLIAMVVLLPLVLRAFVNVVLPHAPRSEFGFLVILALVCAVVTKKLGVYYLVGAFIVGVTAIRLRKRLPVLASDRVLVAVELFASFFIPFYFFRAGLELRPEFFAPRALLLGVLFLALAVPLRVAVVAVYRHLALGESMREGARVGLSLVPTLVFTLVLAKILRTRFELPDELFGALIVFALGNTVLPGLVLHTPPPDFDTPALPRTLAAGGDAPPPATPG